MACSSPAPRAARFPTTVPATPGAMANGHHLMRNLSRLHAWLTKVRLDVEVLVEKEIADHGQPQARKCGHQFLESLGRHRLEELHTFARLIISS